MLKPLQLSILGMVMFVFSSSQPSPFSFLLGIGTLFILITFIQKGYIAVHNFREGLKGWASILAAVSLFFFAIVMMFGVFVIPQINFKITQEIIQYLGIMIAAVGLITYAD
jgi:hypothetical protein